MKKASIVEGSDDISKECGSVNSPWENWGLKKDAFSDCSPPDLRTPGAGSQEVVPWNETDPHMGTITLTNTYILSKIMSLWDSTGPSHN